jgi:hypothetical protein
MTQPGNDELMLVLVLMLVIGQRAKSKEQRAKIEEQRVKIE